MSTSAGTESGPHHGRVGPRRLLAAAGFRRLLYTRFAGQWGEGVFQAGLAGAILFNPEREADPLAIAGGFAALLLPYSLVGPFAGALLDRWDRKRVLVFANLIRAVLVLVTATAVAIGLDRTPLFTLALLVVAVSRFIGSGLSAALPHVVPVRNLVEANALSTTLGSVMSVIGAGCAVGLRAVFGVGNAGSGMTTAVAALGMAAAAVFASRFRLGALGPDAVDEPRQTMVAIARGLFDGGRAALRTPTVRAGFMALLAHRAAFGIALLVSVLLVRFHLDAGLGGLSEVVAMVGVGILASGLVTTWFVTRFGRRRTLAGALVLGAVAAVALGLPMTMATTMAAALVISFAGQTVKLCVDAAVQRDIGDELRGRVFALYDTLVNIAQVVAVAIAATVVPPDGVSVPLVLAASACYAVGLAGYAVVSRSPVAERS